MPFRTSDSGLLDRNESDNASYPFVTSEWTVPSGLSKALSSGRLQLSSGGSALTKFTTRDITAVAECMVYARCARTTAFQLGAGALVSNIASNDGIEASCAGGFSGGRFLVNWAGGSATTIDSTGAGINTTSPQRMTVWCNAARSAALYDHNNGASESGTHAAPAKTGKPAVYLSTSSASTMNVEKFFVFAGRYVTVEGLTPGSGQKAKIRKSDGTVLASATESAGTAVIDCLAVEEYWNIDHLQITDSGDVELDRFTGEVWPGETWSAGTGPDKPTITATAVAARSIRLDSSAYAHDQATPIGGVRWQIATDAAFTLNLQEHLVEYENPEDAPDPPVHTFGDVEPATLHYARVQHQDQAGAWSEWSDTDTATTPAEDKPSTPSITAAVPTPVSVQLSGSAYADPFGRAHVSTDWQVDVAAGDFSSPVNESLADVDVLTSENIPGLVAGTAYKARVRYRADDGSYSDWSAAFSFSALSTPANRPAQPTVAASAITQTSVTLTGSAYSDPQASPHAATEWYITNWPGGGTFGLAYRVLDRVSTTQLLTLPYALLLPGVLYNAAIRYKATDGDWSDWSPWTPFTTVADPLDGALLQIQRPRHGQPVRGAAVSVEWTPASVSGAEFELEYSTDYVTWTPLASGVTASPYSWDVSALIDGVYWLRIRATEGSEVTGWQHRVLVVDNANAQAGGVELFNYLAEDGTDLGTDWEPAWEETDIVWSEGGAGDVRFTGPGFTTFESALTFLPAFEPRQVDVLGEVLIGSLGGAFPWQWFPEQAWGGIGVFAAGPVTGTGPRDGITATIYALPIAAYGDCELRGSGDGFLELAVYDAGQRIYNVLEPIGRVHVVNQFSGCNKVPRYGIRLRLTTIANLPNGRRRLRMQASVTGRGITIPTSGWHHQGTVETALDCGFAAFTARQLTTTVGPYRSFTNLTVIPYEYGACSAPVGFPEPADPESCPAPYFDLTIFDDDDVTPLWGEVDEYGDIVEASFSTDPAHPRPLLVAWQQGSQHEVDPVGGSSNIGSLKARIVDKRTDPCDQGSGFVTVAAGRPDGFSALIGRRAVARERLSDGSVHLVQNGPIKQAVLLDTLVTWDLEIGSMRERERKVPLFDTQHRTLSAYPWGPVDGYGFIGSVFGGAVDLMMLQPAEVARGTFFLSDPAGGINFGYIQNSLASLFRVREGLEEMGLPQPAYDDSGFIGHFFPSVIVRWRYPGDTAWTEIENMPAGGVAHQRNVFEFAETVFFPQTTNFPAVFLAVVRLNSTDINQLPESGRTVEFQVLANTTPSEQFPFFYDGPMGTLLRRIYDGAYSPSPPLVQYDEACMAAFEAKGPWARLRKHEAEDDLRGWVEANIYQASGWLPALTDEGLVCPIDGAVPDGAASLVTLDTGTIILANYSQDGTKASPVVSYEMVRDVLERVSSDPVQYDILTQPLIITRAYVPAADLVKSEALVLRPETIRALGGELQRGAQQFNEFIDEAPQRLGFERVSDILAQNAFGPQIVPVRARDTATNRALTVGTWVILDAAWIPNLQLLARGGPQLGLIIQRQKNAGLSWDFTLLLAGPGTGGLEAPTLAMPDVQDDNSVCITIGAEEFEPYEARIRVQYGVGDTEPTAWRLAGILSEPGTVCTPQQPNGVRVWFRARTEAVGFRPSPWSASVFADVGQTVPALYELHVTIAPDGTPTVTWEANPNTGDVLIEYQVHGTGTVPSYTETVSVDGSLGSWPLTGVTVNEGERISVRATPYTGSLGGGLGGWFAPPYFGPSYFGPSYFGGGGSGGSGGTAGRSLTAYEDMSEELVGSAWSSAFDTSWG